MATLDQSFSCNAEYREGLLTCCSNFDTNHYLMFFVPTPLEWGGGGTIYSNGFFFVQSICADRYNHRRELRLVSLVNSSSVEYWIEKIFLLFVFYRELSRFKLLRKADWNHVIFVHIFRNFCLTFCQFC